jgi:SAM-dependent methyltransferase
MANNEAALAQGELSARQLAAGAHGAAFESIAAALRLAPEMPVLWAQFSDLIRYFNLRHPVPAPVRELLSKALEHPAVDPGNLVRPITTLALSQTDPMGEPLLLRLLEDVVIRDQALERLLVDTRRRMLEEALPLPVMNAIAHQCFNTQYVFDQTAEERAKAETIVSTDPVSLARRAAYQPLKESDPPGSALVRRQVLEPQEERRIAAGIPSLGDARTPVSAKVRAQYEEHPYPRWVRTAAIVAAAGVAGVPPRPRVLVAGCGTGQNAIATARRFPGASLIAIDLSRASLAYASRKTRELGVDGIDYRQADILALEGWPERFDLIECAGVLHHLEDPLAGWRILKTLLKPGGFMRIALYSEPGRRGVVKARELIAAQGLAPDAEGIRAARGAIRARAAADPDLAAIARNEDFYSMSGCRDLLFHVQEHRFELPRIESMLRELGLRFLGFEFADSGAALARYRGDPLDLQAWHRFEQQFPDTFSRMYQFWVT